MCLVFFPWRLWTPWLYIIKVFKSFAIKQKLFWFCGKSWKLSALDPVLARGTTIWISQHWSFLHSTLKNTPHQQDSWAQFSAVAQQKDGCSSSLLFSIPPEINGTGDIAMALPENFWSGLLDLIECVYNFPHLENTRPGLLQQGSESLWKLSYKETI